LSAFVYHFRAHSKSRECWKSYFGVPQQKAGSQNG